MQLLALGAVDECIRIKLTNHQFGDTTARHVEISQENYLQKWAQTNTNWHAASAEWWLSNILRTSEYAQHLQGLLQRVHKNDDRIRILWKVEVFFCLQSRQGVVEQCAL